MLSKTMRVIGRFWGATFLRHVVLAYTRRRVSRLKIHVDGVVHLQSLAGQSYILVSNHVPPRDCLLKAFKMKAFDRFNHAIDSFVYQQIIHEHTGQWIRVVAKYGRDHWYGPAPMRFLQRHVRQPLTRGQLEGAGYVPVDLKQGSIHRDFLKLCDEILQRRGALLIFPEGNVFDEFESGALRNGAAHLAHRRDLPILPAYIVGSHSWRPGRRVDVRFGPPIPTQGLNKRQIAAKIRIGILALRQAGEEVFLSNE